MSDKYSSWKKRQDTHDTLHHSTVPTKGIKEDLSCNLCHPLLVTNRKFIRFWKWYQKEVPQVEAYSGKTEETLSELLTVIEEKITKHQKQNKDREQRIISKIGKLLGCMRYRECPINKESIIRKDLIEIIVASDGFKKSLKESEELWEIFTNNEADSYYSKSDLEEKEDKEDP